MHSSVLKTVSTVHTGPKHSKFTVHLANITFHDTAQHLSCFPRTVRRVGGNVASCLRSGAPVSPERDKSGRASGREEHPGSSCSFKTLCTGVLVVLRHPPVSAPLPLAGIPRGPGWRGEREKSGRRWLPSPSQQPASDPPPPPVRLSQPIRGGGRWADTCFVFCPLSRVYFSLSRYSAIPNDRRLNCKSSSAAARSQNILVTPHRSYVGPVFFFSHVRERE